MFLRVPGRLVSSGEKYCVILWAMIAPVCYTLLFRGLVKLLNIESAHSITGGYHHAVFPGFLLGVSLRLLLFNKMPVAVQAENQIPSFFRQIGNQLDVTDCQGKLKLVFQPGFLQHVCHMEFDR